VVGVAMFGSLTVLPALMTKLGDRIDRGRIPWLGRRLERRRVGGESRVWAAIVRPALARPLATVVLAAGFLVLLAVPAFHLKTASPGVTDLPRNLAVIKTYHRIEQAYGANPVPAQVVISARNVDSTPVAAAIANLKREALASGQMHQPITVDVNRSTRSRASRSRSSVTGRTRPPSMRFGRYAARSCRRRSAQSPPHT
jgi:RND superfamily putative drug exporter